MRKESQKYTDLTEEGSKRTSNELTTAARQAESDDINEERNTGPVNSTDDKTTENEVWISLSDE